MANGKTITTAYQIRPAGRPSKFPRGIRSCNLRRAGEKPSSPRKRFAKLLYGGYSVGTSHTFKLNLAAKFPVNKDSGLSLLEERPVVREMNDLIVSSKTTSSIEEILQEHNRKDVLESYGLFPAQKLLFFGPPGCGKTLAAEVIASALSLPLILVRLDSLISSFLGETASNLRKVFDIFQLSRL
jgi:ATP-dependent 26S proteasome regulatory subunit